MADRCSFLCKILTSFFLICSSPAAQEINEINRDQALGKTVSHITVLGLERTTLDVVHRELLIVEGKPLQLSALDESLQRLKNLRIFHSVVDSYYLDDNGQLHVRLTVAESYTTIPILKITEGGGTRYLVAGVYDINTLGHYFESGIQYEAWNGEDGGVVWFRNPRFMNQRIRFGADLWSVKRPRDLYQPDGDSEGDFVTYQRKLNVFIDKEWLSDLTLGAGVELNKTQLLDGSMSDALSMEISQAIDNHSAVNNHWVRMYASLGRLDYDNVLLQGRISELNILYASPGLGSDYKAYRTTWDNRFFWPVRKRATLAWRLKWAKTDSNQLQDLYYVGGFDNVRGYFDGQIRGKQYWQSNFEYREIVFQSNWFYLQGNLFADVAQLINPTSPVESQTDDVFYSTGIGLRLGSPKIYRFVARLDFAINTSHPATSRFSFAVQQFF